MRRIVLLATLVLAVFATGALAAPVDLEVPTSVPVKLKTGLRYWFRWALFDTADEGVTLPVWAEEMDTAGAKLPLRTKKLSHVLGTIAAPDGPLDAGDFSQQLWLQVFRWKSGAWAPCSARVKLNLVPYALRSLVSEGGAAGSVTNVMLGDGVVTDAKITGPIDEAKIDAAVARDSEVTAAVEAHATRTDNPHLVTAAQVGAAPAANGVPSGYAVLGQTATAPAGYTFTGSLLGGTTYWTTKAAMPTARSGAGAAVANGKIYVLGGYKGWSVATNEAYDPATNTWEARADMPTARHDLAVAEAGGKIYAIGGEVYGVAGAVAANEAYDPVANTWAGKSGMPTPRSKTAVAAVGGKIYVVTGRDLSGYLATNEVFDPALNSWATETDASMGRRNAVAVAVGTKVYLFGGMNSSGDLLETEVFDPATHAWAGVADMPTARKLLAATSIGTRIYVLGGWDAISTATRTNESYDTVGDSWTTEVDMPTPRRMLCAAAVGGRIYAIGGHDGTSVVSQNEEFLPGGSAETWYLHRKD